MTDSTEDRWLTMDDVAVMCGVPVSMVKGWRKGAANNGPKFYRLSQNVVRYRETDVTEWLAAQAVDTKG